MNSTSAMSAPTPGDGIDLAAAAWPSRKSISGMIRLRRSAHELLLGLLFAQVLVGDDEVGQHKAERGADAPRHDDSPENPIGKPQHIGQRCGIAPIAEAV